MLINGKQIAKQIYDELKNEVQSKSIKAKLSIILLGNNPSSLRYIQQKEKWAQYVGITFELIKFEENTSEQELIKKIYELNNDKNVTWFMVQLPLPKHINEEKIIHSIHPKKDVDGFHPENQWKIMIWDKSGLFPCTPAGIMEILQYENIHVSWKVITVIWRSNIVGKPITNMLINAGATLISCNSKTKNLTEWTKVSDIIIIATGKPHMLTKDMIQENSVIIDVWFTVIDGNIYGDADTENIEKIAKITPVPWGVGALTVAMLMKNTIKAYYQSWK